MKMVKVLTLAKVPKARFKLTVGFGTKFNMEHPRGQSSTTVKGLRTRKYRWSNTVAARHCNPAPRVQEDNTNLDG